MTVPYEIVAPIPPGNFLRKMYVTFWDRTYFSVVVEVLSRNVLKLSYHNAENGKNEEQVLTSFDDYVVFYSPPYLAVKCSVYSSITDTLRTIGIAVGGK